MPTELQERRIGEAWDALGRWATAKQIWRYLSGKYQRPGFKGVKSVAHVLRIIKGRTRPYG